MKRIPLLLIFVLCCAAAGAQQTISISVRSAEGSPLPGATATIDSLNLSVLADSLGVVIFKNLSAGSYRVAFSHIGHATKVVGLRVPRPEDDIIEVILEESEEHEEEEVVIRATRIRGTIANIPTRVEVISGEELTEKGNMKPGDIRMLLNESTGIQTQQTSATSFNSGIRIQGLEGRYTQLLRDGYPLYAGFSGGLSILQIAPLDLKQVEVIKGSASTLYGGGAIAGLVNLVSKTPGEERELSFLANGTTAGGLDLSGFYSERYGKLGLTVFGSRNSNAPFDPADIGLTAIPKFERYTINPRLFFYGGKTTVDVGLTYVTEDRTGGSMSYIKDGGTGFFERNNTDRIITQLGIAHELSEGSFLQFKNSYSRFDRVITIPAYTFDALQQSSFSELTLNLHREKLDWVVGANLLTDDLRERSITADPKRDYRYITYGLFIQNVWTLSRGIKLESGLRGDYVDQFGFALLPRLSAMFRITPKLTTRLGGGYGYKSPTIFTEEAERRQFQGVLPIDQVHSGNERSVGGNWDVNFRTSIGELVLSFNHLFFYTRLNDPLVLVNAPGGKVEFKNSTGYLDAKGMETNLRLSYDDLKLFLGYTYTDANIHNGSSQEWLPLTARHRVNTVLMYEKEEKLKIGLEAYYFSKQRLSDGSFGRSYWITGLMAEKLWENFSIFINFENFSDTRQSKFDVIYTGSINNPVFKDIYAPVEGFVVNGGIKIRL